MSAKNTRKPTARTVKTAPVTPAAAPVTPAAAPKGKRRKKTETAAPAVETAAPAVETAAPAVETAAPAVETPAPAAETPVAKKAGTPAAAHPRDETGAGFAFATPRRAGAGIDPLGYSEGSRGNVLAAVLLKLPDTHAGLTASELTTATGPLTRKGGATEDSIRAALSHMMHRAYVVLMGGRYTLTARARATITAVAK